MRTNVAVSLIILASATCIIWFGVQIARICNFTNYGVTIVRRTKPFTPEADLVVLRALAAVLPSLIPLVHSEADAEQLASMLAVAAITNFVQTPSHSPTPQSVGSADVPPIPADRLNPDELLRSTLSCYENGDGSEICAVEGTLCFDGTRPFLIGVNHQSTADMERPSEYEIPGESDCVDADTGIPVPCHTVTSPRPHNVLTWTRSQVHVERWSISKLQPSLQKPDKLRTLLKMLASTDSLNDLGSPPSASTSPDKQFSTVAAVVHDDGVLWTDAKLSVIPMPSSASHHVLDFLAGAGQLYTAARAQATRTFGEHPHDGYMHKPDEGLEYIGQKPSLYRYTSMDHFYKPASTSSAVVQKPEAVTNVTSRFITGSQWVLPSIERVLFTDMISAQSALPSSWRDELESFLLSLHPNAIKWVPREMLTSSQTNEAKVESPLVRAVCSVRGGTIASLRRSTFDTHADAWLFRQYLYSKIGNWESAQGTNCPTQSMYPPRTILLILDEDEDFINAGAIHNDINNDDSSKVINPMLRRTVLQNRKEIRAAAEATGLFVRTMSPRLIMEHPIGKLSAQLCSVGILVGGSSPALSLAMLVLPAHAAVLEIAGLGAQDARHSQLASHMQLHYAVVRAHDPAATRWMHPACASVNASAAADFSEYWECRGLQQASLLRTVKAPIRPLRRFLDDAVDAIGAYSMLNPTWAAMVAAEKLPPPTQLTLLANDADVTLNIWEYNRTHNNDTSSSQE